MPTITTVDATWDTGVTMDAAELRRADTTMFLGDGTNNGVRGGIVRHGDNSLAVNVNGSDQVTVQPGAFVVPAATGLGVYRGALSATTSAVALTARNATNPRIDLVVIQVTGINATIKTIDGTPSSSPVAPALPAQHIELARLAVPQVGGGAVGGDVSFRNYVTAIGGTMYVATKARLPGSGNQKGQRAVAVDTGYSYTWTGAAWTPVGLTVTNGPSTTASGTKVYRQSDSVHVNVNLTATATLTTNARLAILPTDCWPPETWFGGLLDTTGDVPVRVGITDTTGELLYVGAASITSGHIIRGSISFPI